MLVVWPVHRADWLRPFKALALEFDLIFLLGFSSSNEHNEVESYASCYHWSEFESAGEIINKINPDKIVFMSLEGGLNIALNIVAQYLGIKTYILQHGIYTNYKDYRFREKIWEKTRTIIEATTNKTESEFSTTRFILKSLPLARIYYLFPLFFFLYALRKQGPYWAAKHLSFEGKRPDYYLCFSPYNAGIHKELDGIGEDRIIYIGSYELERYLIKENTIIDDRFYLHIDQAFAENSFGEETVSVEEMIEFYEKLNSFCLANSARLYIKLHPESYNSDWLPEDPNIIYLKDIYNLNVHIQSSLGCFGFYSTLVIPAVYWKPVVLFNIYYSGLQEELSKIANVCVLNFKEFEAANIIFPEFIDVREHLIETFFYRTDLESNDRLLEILNE